MLRIRLQALQETSGAETGEHEVDGTFPHLVARHFYGPVQRRKVVVALDRPPTTDMVTRFANKVFVPRYGDDGDLPVDLVHLGDAATDQFVQAAATRRKVPVAVRRFAHYQVVWDATRYLVGQAQRLTGGTYVDKRRTNVVSPGAPAPARLSSLSAGLPLR